MLGRLKTASELSYSKFCYKYMWFIKRDTLYFLLRIYTQIWVHARMFRRTLHESTGAIHGAKLGLERLTWAHTGYFPVVTAHGTSQAESLHDEERFRSSVAS